MALNRPVLSNRLALQTLVALTILCSTTFHAHAQFIEREPGDESAIENTYWTVHSGAQVRTSGDYGDSKTGAVDTFLDFGLRRELDWHGYFAVRTAFVTTDIGSEESFKFALRPAYGRSITPRLEVEIAPSLNFSRRVERWGGGAQFALRHEEGFGAIVGFEAYPTRNLTFRDGTMETRGGVSSYFGLELSSPRAGLAATAYMIHSLAVYAARGISGP